MARPQKSGLDYFPLDVDMDQDDKIALIEAQHGILGFAIVIKLLMKIYKSSYFYEWTEKEQLLFSNRVNVDINEVNVVINDCVKWGLFNSDLLETHKILTSKGIQRRYLEAVGRRQKVKMSEEYLLLDNETVNAYKNLVIVNINGVNADINPQSKVKKSKEKKSKVNNNNDDVVDNNSKNIFKTYESCGFGTISSFIKDELEDMVNNFTFEWTKEALEIATTNGVRNLKYVRSILNNWKAKGKDYKPKQYNKDEKVDSFNNYEQREYDFNELEKKLLGWQNEGSEEQT
ncbi:Lin1244/Lin1753 domain-containing protein [Clostridium botulinum]|uniref:Lin1244/Lin1753 domain-containing protein n=1 Tax=Clostridium botulinum TaxID=1491 RepID=UPI0006A50BB5|nr:Lin1244/Lin1753 domain-containing protein [Clostridium botulinum]KOC33879.1 DNA damage-inducible protein DnaD [Clostridium botulinum]